MQDTAHPFTCLTGALFLALTAGSAAAEDGALLFEENFEQGLSAWRLHEEQAFRLIDAGDETHGKVLELSPAGVAYALIKESDRWGAVGIEGEFQFPTDRSAYLGLVYNYGGTEERTDFGSIYLKGDGSYLRVNPWRDGNASRLLYEEYRTNITGDDAVKAGQWNKFRAEIKGAVVHFYVGDLTTPKLIFPHYERDSGMVGFKPRVTGAPVWLDNIRVTQIDEFSNEGAQIPAPPSYRDKMLADWQAIGPLAGASAAVERSTHTQKNGSRRKIRSAQMARF